VTIVKNQEEPLYGEFTFDLVEDLIIGGNVNDDNYYFQRGVMLILDTGTFKSMIVPGNI